MYDYTKLHFSKELSDILQEQMLDNDYDLLLFLEKYKFYAREQLVKFLNDVNEGITFVAIEADFHSEGQSFRKMDGCLINKIDSNVYELICTIGNDINIPVIELRLGGGNISVVYVTPLNFLELLGGYTPEYEPVILFRRILIEAIHMGATDLHFDVKHNSLKPEYIISVRLNGELRPMDLFDLNADLNKRIICALIERKTAASGLDLSDSAGVIASSSGLLGNGDTELRIAANKVLDGYHYVIRIQRKSTFNFTIDRLGFNKDVQDELNYIVQKRSGITLITGAMRTGKNTTAFAVMNEMVKEPIKIVSYESPIEVLMPFTQMDYMEDENILANAIRLAKKQDVNIAFVNEIPNKEVAFAVQDLVNSSVHVITTMHINRIWHLPYKLKEYYGESYKDIISQINAVFNQKMFGVACKKCQDAILVDSLDNNRYKRILQRNNVTTIKRSRGCTFCDNIGLIPGKNQPYVEYLEFTDDVISDLLQCDSPHEMEIVIKQHVMGNELEHHIAHAISAGDLPLSALNFV